VCSVRYTFARYWVKAESSGHTLDVRPIANDLHAYAHRSRRITTQRRDAHELAEARQLVIVPRLFLVTKNPDDDKFLECADAARADYLVTGNQRHLPKFWKKTKVITSREFIGVVAPHLIL